MMKKKNALLSNEQEVRTIAEEEILAEVTGGVDPLKPLAVIGRPFKRSGRALPFGLVRPLRTAPNTLGVSHTSASPTSANPTSAFKPYEEPRVPDLNLPASSN